MAIYFILAYNLSNYKNMYKNTKKLFKIEENNVIIYSNTNFAK